MSKLGILLACDHYPRAAHAPQHVDAQLRLWLATFGTTFDDVEWYHVHEGQLPRHAAGCDAWVVSGVPISLPGSTVDTRWALTQFLRAAAACGRSLFAVHHGEHMLHSALAAFDAAPPVTPSVPRTVRNPFWSFHGRDTLHRFNPRTRSIEPLPRPQCLHQRDLLGAFRRAA